MWRLFFIHIKELKLKIIQQLNMKKKIQINAKIFELFIKL